VRKRRAGFTLLEVLIVLAVFVIIAGGVSYFPAERRRVTAAALMLQTDMRYAQRLALTEGNRVDVTFNMADKSYRIDAYKDGKSAKIKSESLDGYIVTLYTNASNACVGYTARGTTGSSCTINL